MTKKIESGEELNSLLKGLAANITRKKKVNEQGKEEGQEGSLVDKINFQSSRNIASELTPELLTAERKEKIAKLKEQIQAGTYKPKSEDIAAALQQDIVFEILSNPKDAVNE